MKFKMEIEVEELKDGSFVVKLGDKVLGEVDNLNPIDTIDNVSSFIRIVDYMTKIKYLEGLKPQIEQELKRAVKEELAKLIAYYSIDW